MLIPKTPKPHGDERLLNMNAKLLVQATLIAMVLYNSYLGMHDKMNRTYFETRYQKTVLFLVGIKEPTFMECFKAVQGHMKEENMPKFAETSPIAV